MSRRLPLEPEGRRQRTDPSFQPGSTRGRIGNASPVGDGGGRGRVRPTSPGNTGPGGGAQFFDQFDTATLTVAGAQDKTLTYLPLPFSEHVFLNGLRQTRGTDFLLSGQQLNVQAAMDARPGDTLVIEYAYSGGVPVAPSDGVIPLNIPYTAPGWSYITGWVAGSQVVGFDASGWAVGATPIGAGTFTGTNAGAASLWSVRRLLPAGTSIQVNASAQYGSLYADGVLLSSTSTGSQVTFGGMVGTKNATWCLTLEAQYGNGATGGYVDIEVSGIKT